MAVQVNWLFMNQTPQEKDNKNISEIFALKDKIKEVMFSVLSDIFEAQHDHQDQLNPSFLASHVKRSQEQIEEELKNLKEALEKLDLFCQSAQKQLSKAIEKTKKEQIKIFDTPVQSANEYKTPLSKGHTHHHLPSTVTDFFQKDPFYPSSKKDV